MVFGEEMGGSMKSIRSLFHNEHNAWCL